MVRKFVGILVVSTLLIGSVVAQSLKNLKPNYDEDILEIEYIRFIDSLDPMVIKSNYPKAIKNLLSVSVDKQKIGIKTLSATKEIDIIPWLVRLVNSNDTYVEIEAYFAMKELVSYYSLKRRDFSKPEGIFLRSISEEDVDLRPLAWLVLQMLRLPDSEASIRSYAATMAGYLNLKIFRQELNDLLESRHPATVNSAKYAIELLENGHQ